jgi:hypothetical protein
LSLRECPYLRIEIWGTEFYAGYRCGPPARLNIAFELAAKRRQKVTSVDKANVFEVSHLWRPVANRPRS